MKAPPPAGAHSHCRLVRDSGAATSARPRISELSRSVRFSCRMSQATCSRWRRAIRGGRRVCAQTADAFETGEPHRGRHQSGRPTARELRRDLFADSVRAPGHHYGPCRLPQHDCTRTCQNRHMACARARALHSGNPACEQGWQGSGGAGFARGRRSAPLCAPASPASRDIPGSRQSSKSRSTLTRPGPARPR
jgi:hypothetical protein